VREHAAAAHARDEHRRQHERQRIARATSLYDFKTYLQSGADHSLAAGAEVFLQCWSRDPASASTTSLSNALCASDQSVASANSRLWLVHLDSQPRTLQCRSRSYRTSASIALFALAARAQQVVWTFTGSVGDEYGATLLQTADQNGDGYPDVMVGAPGYNGGRGYIRCVSGKFLATGVGSATLWTLYPSVSAGARFGSAIAEVDR
jgi:hypothetical protein